MRTAAFSLLLLCSLLPQITSSSERKPDQSVVRYLTKPGDTLGKIAQKYLRQPSDIYQIYKNNRLGLGERLPVGEELVFPRHLVRHTPSQATVMNISCATDLLSDDPSKSWNIGSQLSEGDVINVPSECHASLLLDEGSIVRLPSNAAVKIAVLRKSLLESVPEVRLELIDGRIELNVNKGRGKATPFEVRTPLSVMGVRGTEFRAAYSQRDQSALVEVLEGIVGARGKADAGTQSLTEGLGMPIDRNGKGAEPEALLPAPGFSRVESGGKDAQWFVLHFDRIARANYYIANTFGAVNLGGNQMTRNLLSPEIFLPRLSKQAVFYQMTSVSPSGLIGTAKTFAFCSHESKSPGCNLMIDTPLADNTPISLAMTRLQEGGTEQLILDEKNLRVSQGRFIIKGVEPGRYSWNLAYAPSARSTSESKIMIRESGVFDLIALPAQ